MINREDEMMKKLMITVVVGLLVFTAQSFASRDELKDELKELRREAREGIKAERSQANGARELRAEDSEGGRTVIDVRGNRVRVEKYLSRPADNQIRVVVLNTRPGLADRVDQVNWTGTFNQDLPLDLRGIGRGMWGSRGGPRPEYYITNVLRVATSGDNSLTVTRDGGWLYTFAKLGEREWCLVIFNNELLTINGIGKIERERINYDIDLNLPGMVKIYYPHRDDSVLTHALTRIGVTGQIIWLGTEDALALPTKHEWEREPNEHHLRDKLVFADGTWISRDRYLIDDEGHVLERDADDPGHWLPFWRGNREIIHGASEFDGETIDIVITPGPAEEVGY